MSQSLSPEEPVCAAGHGPPCGPLAITRVKMNCGVGPLRGTKAWTRATTEHVLNISKQQRSLAMFGFDPKCSNTSQSVQSNLGYLYFKDILEYFRCICFGHLWVSQCFAKLRIQPTTMTEAEADTPEW